MRAGRQIPESAVDQRAPARVRPAPALGGALVPLAVCVWLAVGSGANAPPLGASLRVIYTTDTQGRLDVCGCSAGQHGGLPRRATLLRHLRSEAQAVIVIDGGSAVTKASHVDPFARAYRSMAYDLVLHAATALEGAFAEALTREGVDTLHRPLEPGGVACQVLEADEGLELLVLVTPDPAGADADALAQSLRGAIQAATAGRDPAARRAVVVITGESPTGNARLAERVGDEVDLFLGASSPVITSDYREPIAPGPVAPAIAGGKALTVIDIGFPADGGRPEVAARYEPVAPDLLPDIEVGAIIEDYYASQKLSAGLEGDAPDEFALDYAMRGWADAMVCAECHLEEYGLWRGTAHAHAIDTLAGRGRLVDECLTCHSEGFRRGGSFNPEAIVPGDGVTCATCHGDGVVHSMTGRVDAIERRVSADLCIGCHDEERQPLGFDFEASWRLISHGSDNAPAEGGA